MTSRRRKRTGPPPRPAAKPHRPRRTTGPATRAQQAAAAAQARKQARRRRLVIALLLVAAVAAVAAYVVTSRRADASLRQALTSGTCDVDTESDQISGDGHVESPTYTVDPPAGGDHLSSWARGGVYAGDAVPPEGQLVHALEHGYVVAWHAPDLPAEQVEQLAAFEQRHDGDVIVAEREGMSTPVAATAWGQRLLCGEVEPETLDRFAEEHVGNGPEDVERG